MKESLTTVLPAAVLILLGYFLLDRFRLANESMTVEVNSAEKIEQYIVELIRAKTTTPDGERPLDDDEITGKALALSAFGRPAVVPLLQILNRGGNRVPPAVEGLVSVGKAHPAYTCAVLADVLTDTSRAFQWTTHEAVIRILPRVGCESETLVEKYRVRVEQNPGKIFSGPIPPHVGQEGYLEIVDSALELLQ